MSLVHYLAPKLALLGSRQCWRLLHGRGGLFPPYFNIAVEWYQPAILIILYRQEHLEDVEELCVTLRQYSEVKAVVLQRRYIAGAPKELIWGVIPSPHVVRENDVSIQLNLLENQNHGLFLDSYLVRKRVGELSKDKSVLNLFAYTCVFSLYALNSGAKSVVNMDMNKSSMRIGESNHRLNGLLKGVHFFAHDIFKSFAKIMRFGPYDLIIVDPPSMQWQSFDYRKDYRKLLMRLLPALSAGGEMILCLNDPEESSDFLLSMLDDLSLELKESLPLAEGFEEKNPAEGLKVIRVANCLNRQ